MLTSLILSAWLMVPAAGKSNHQGQPPTCKEMCEKMADSCGASCAKKMKRGRDRSGQCKSDCDLMVGQCAKSCTRMDKKGPPAPQLGEGGTP